MNYKLCQLDFTVGDLKGNSDKIIDIINKEKEDPKQTSVLIFSELSIIGYPPLDLLDKNAFIEDQLKYADQIRRATTDCPSLVIIGCAEKNPDIGRNLFNSALVMYKGELIYHYRKRLLPTYDIFDEARYFEPGKEMGLFNFRGKRIGIVICEDLWYRNKFYRINPAQELFNADADLIISLNASPSVVDKFEQKVEMVKNISSLYGLPIIYVNQVGGNDDIVFDGNSFVINERGVFVAQAKRFEEEILVVPEEALLAHTQGYSLGIKPNYFESNAQFFYEQAVAGVRGYVKKCRFKGVMIAESGGIDSAVVTAIAADAIGGDNVTGVTMPSQYSSEGSYKDSELLCKNFGVKFYKLSIENVFKNMIDDFNAVFGKPDKTGLAEENLQARIRGMINMTYSNRYDYLLLSTGNKSELSVGYCTYAGDMLGGLSPISDLYKMEVYAVAKYRNLLANFDIIPQSIIEKEPSAELAPGQKDTDSLPPYPILDVILKYVIEGDVLSCAERETCKNIMNKYPEYVKKVLKLINKAEFKRRQAAITIKMHEKAFGYGRRVPIAHKWGIVC